MPALEPRDWATFCPRRYDLPYIAQQNPNEIALIGGSGMSIKTMPQQHKWSQYFTIISVNLEDGEGNARQSPPMFGPEGFHCKRCLARMNDQGILIGFIGDPEEMEYMRKLQADAMERMQKLQEEALAEQGTDLEAVDESANS